MVNFVGRNEKERYSQESEEDMARIARTKLLRGIASKKTLWAVLAILVMPSEAQNLSPYSAFQNLSPTALQTVQVKLTYAGSQKNITSTAAFSSPTNALDLTGLVPSA